MLEKALNILAPLPPLKTLSLLQIWHDAHGDMETAATAANALIVDNIKTAVRENTQFAISLDDPGGYGFSFIQRAFARLQQSSGASTEQIFHHMKITAPNGLRPHYRRSISKTIISCDTL